MGGGGVSSVSGMNVRHHNGGARLHDLKAKRASLMVAVADSLGNGICDGSAHGGAMLKYGGKVRSRPSLIVVLYGILHLLTIPKTLNAIGDR